MTAARGQIMQNRQKIYNGRDRSLKIGSMAHFKLTHLHSLAAQQNFLMAYWSSENLSFHRLRLIHGIITHTASKKWFFGWHLIKLNNRPTSFKSCESKLSNNTKLVTVQLTQTVRTKFVLLFCILYNRSKPTCILSTLLFNMYDQFVWCGSGTPLFQMKYNSILV